MQFRVLVAVVDSADSSQQTARFSASSSSLAVSVLDIYVLAGNVNMNTIPKDLKSFSCGRSHTVSKEKMKPKKLKKKSSPLTLLQLSVTAI